MTILSISIRTFHRAKIKSIFFTNFGTLYTNKSETNSESTLHKLGC